MSCDNRLKKNIGHHLNYNAKVRADFSKASTTYDDYAQLQQQNYLYLADYAKHALQALSPDTLAIDIGAGSGAGLALFQQVSPRLQWLALDMSHSMLKEHHCASLKCVADMANLPIASGSMRLALSNFSLHWSAHMKQALQEIQRVLDYKGVAIISVPTLGSLDLLQQAWAEQGLPSPLHNLPDQHDILDYLHHTDCKIQYQYRRLPLPLQHPNEVFQWLKNTGSRQKSRATKTVTKTQYLSIVSFILARLTAGEALDFKMLDIILCQ